MITDLREIPKKIAENNIFSNTENVSNTTIARVQQKHQIRMKLFYIVPFKGNSKRVKELRYKHVRVSHGIYGDSELNNTHRDVLSSIVHNRVSGAICVFCYLVYSLIYCR